MARRELAAAELAFREDLDRTLFRGGDRPRDVLPIELLNSLTLLPTPASISSGPWCVSTSRNSGSGCARDAATAGHARTAGAADACPDAELTVSHSVGPQLLKASRAVRRNRLLTALLLLDRFTPADPFTPASTALHHGVANGEDRPLPGPGATFAIPELGRRDCSCVDQSRFIMRRGFTLILVLACFGSCS